MRPTSVRIRSWSVWLILMRKTSAPASNSFFSIASVEEAGPMVARILTLRLRLIGLFVPVAAAAPSRCGLVGQLDHPARLLARVIFLKTGALETAREAIVDAGDLELFFSHAHVDRAVPAPAALGVFCIKIVKPR